MKEKIQCKYVTWLLVYVFTTMSGPIKILVKAKQKPQCVLNVACCDF